MLKQTKNKEKKQEAFKNWSKSGDVSKNPEDRNSAEENRQRSFNYYDYLNL